MKKINLIERLLSYSHEKQTPQRFGRYAAMLIMLLTIGVGQMWAKTFYLLPFSSWSSDGCKYAMCYGKDGGSSNTFVAMTQVTGTSWYSAEIPSSASDKDVYFMRVSGSWKESDGWTNKYNGFGWYSYSNGDRYKGTNWDAGEKVNVGFESSLNGIKYYKNSDANDTEWSFNGQSAQTTDLSTVSNLLLKEWFTYEYEGNDIWTAKDDGSHSGWTGIGATVMKYNVHRTESSAGAYTSVNKNWTSNEDWAGGYKKSKAGHNNINSGGVNLLSGLGSGKYTMSFYYYDPVLNITSPTHSLKWTLAPPAMSTHTVSSDGSGSGTDGSPFLMAVGNTLTITVSGTQASSDANSVLYVSFDNGSTYSSTTTKSISITNTTKTSVKIKAKYYNSADDLSGTVYDFGDVYYQGTVTPSISLSAPSTAVRGNSIDLTATPLNASTPTIYYEYSSSSTFASDVNSIASTTSTTQAWTVPSGTAGTTYYLRAKMQVSSTWYYSSIQTLTAYGKKTLKVKNEEKWGSMYLYAGDGNTGSWPGTTTTGSNGFSISRIGTSQWWTVVITSANSTFILNNGSSGAGNQTGDLSYSSYDDNGSYGCYNHSGSTVDGRADGQLYNRSAPTTPTVTTDDLSASAATTAVFGAHLTATGNDKVTVYGIKYKQSDSNLADAAAIEAASPTTIVLGTNKEAAANATTSQTITAGKDYYYIAYATNGFGTTYGVVRKLRTTSITLNKESGSGGSGNFVALGGKTISAITAPTRTGYNFAGYWTSENDESGTKYFNANGSANVSNWPTNLGASLTLYAHWTAKTTTVTLDINTATSGSNQTVLATYGVSMPLVTTAVGTPAIEVPSKTGYTLLGYWDAKTNGNQYYAYGGTPAALSSYQNWNKEDATKTLYARWQANTYTLTLKKYNGQDDAEATATYDATISVTPPSKTGYTFNGYYTASSGGTQIIAADGHFVASVTNWTNSSKQWRRTSDETLHAQWTAHTYTIAFDWNENGKVNYVGTPTGTTASIDATYDVSYTLTANGFSRQGYTFAGWNTNADGTSGTSYTDEQTGVNNLTAVDDATVTLYAKWTGRTYTVTFDARGGSSLSANSSTVTMGDLYINGSGLGGDLPTVTAPAGYVFQGWYTASSGGTLVTDETRVTTASDHTLYAHYIQQTRVYFKNTLNWSEVYVTYDATWHEDQGAGNVGKIYHKMTLLDEEEKIYVDVIPEDVIRSWKYNIAFNSQQLGKINDDWTGDYTGFNKGSAVFRRDFDSYATMFVPEVTKDYDKNGVAYYSTDQWVDTKTEDDKEVVTDYRYKDGYWRTYNEKEAGYVVKGTWDSESMDHAFRSTDPYGTTFSFTRTLVANTDYYFRIYKHCKTSNTYSSWFIANDKATITSSITDWTLSTSIAKTETSRKDHIKTTAAGDYTITLKLGTNGVIKIDVTYPLVANDYRVLYSWTDGSARFGNYQTGSKQQQEDFCLCSQSRGFCCISFAEDSAMYGYQRKWRSYLD